MHIAVGLDDQLVLSVTRDKIKFVDLKTLFHGDGTSFCNDLELLVAFRLKMQITIPIYLRHQHSQYLFFKISLIYFKSMFSKK